MTQQELHIWQTLAQSSDSRVRAEASLVLSVLQQRFEKDGYYDGSWREKQNKFIGSKINRKEV